MASLSFPGKKTPSCENIGSTLCNWIPIKKDELDGNNHYQIFFNCYNQNCSNLKRLTYVNHVTTRRYDNLNKEETRQKDISRKEYEI